ncbi:YDG/SRA domain-containing protein [Streptomyces sp. NPDC090022]|uniref:YDG/SRA domain-containing protein n=1 Tax=Streptomyces sp. NPDC090022 TaxID=3365920 RepID=UPI003814024C
MKAERVIGHIEGVVPGRVLERRTDVRDASLHSDTMRGISRLKDADGTYVSDAIVLSGGYLDDDDAWHQIRYTGASPDAEKHPETKQPMKNQSWDYRDNAALKLSWERKHPIRILRGHKGDARYSPRSGYRYDGLYVITAIRTATSQHAVGPAGEPIEICQFDLERLPEPAQELTQIEIAAAEVLGFGDGEKFPQTRTTQVQRMIRDTAAARRIKELYDGQCQTCGIRLVGAGAKPYSQGAHLKPLAAPHRGPDVERNILCLCPNCHVRLDLGAISFDDDWSVIDRAPEGEPRTTRPKLLMKKGHGLHPGYARYQREWWDKLWGETTGE